MNEPRRLLEESRDQLVLDLVGAWREQRAHSAARARTAGALGLATVASSGAAWGAVGVARAAPLVLSRFAILKWFAGGALCGLVMVTGAEAVHRRPAPRASVEPDAASEPVARPTRAVTPPVASRAETWAPPPSARFPEPPQPPTASKPAPASIAGEIIALDRARQALTQGNASRALAVLDELEASGHTDTFAPELLWLRLEALDQVGQHQRARELALGYLAEHPSGPIAGRLRARWR